MKEGITQTIKEIADNLQSSKEFHLQQAERATRQKLQLNSLEREEAEHVFHCYMYKVFNLCRIIKFVY